MAHVTVRCVCGKVELEAVGEPIVTVACYCDDCQGAGKQIEALPNAAPVLGADGGTAYLAYRKDRVRTTRGAELLRGYKLRPGSATTRMVATCCNAAVILRFEDRKHWVDVYRDRVVGDAPALQMRTGTKYRQAGAVTDGVPSFPGYPLRLVGRLVTAKIAILLGV